MTSFWLAVSLKKVRFPDLCIHCAAQPSGAIAIERVRGIRQENSLAAYAVESVTVQICPSCVAVHQREVRKFSLLEKVICPLRTWSVIPFLCSSFVGIYLLHRGGFDLINLAFAGAFLAIAAFCYWVGWRGGRYRLVPPPTSITSSIDFSEQKGGLFEKKRRQFTFANHQYATMFLQMNQRWHYNPSSPENVANRMFRRYVAWIFFALLIATGLYLAWRDGEL